jgi:CRP-like cAMP-binding protein
MIQNDSDLNKISRHDMAIKCDCEQCALRTAFFESFSQDELEVFCSQKADTAYNRGDIIFREGDEVKNFSYLKSGLVKLFKSDNRGKDQILAIAGPFDFVSLLGIFSESYHTYSVAVLEDSVLCHIEIAYMKNIALKNGLYTLNLMEKLSAITNKIILESMEIRRRNTHGKVAFILLKLSKLIYSGEVFELPISRKEMAEYLGITTENVIRTMSEFRKEKLIRINGREIEIVNQKVLEQISSFG